MVEKGLDFEMNSGRRVFRRSSLNWPTRPGARVRNRETGTFVFVLGIAKSEREIENDDTGWGGIERNIERNIAVGPGN
jgi:hypothetical protein